jgi:hypothetical protein
MAKQPRKKLILPRKAKGKCSDGGFYSNHFDGINFRERFIPIISMALTLESVLNL